MAKSLLIILLVLLGANAQAHIFIGNAGDGVMIGDRVYLYDLFLNGRHLTPPISKAIDAELPPLPSSEIMGFDYPKELLARKLTDINEATDAGLGDYLLIAMKYYNWILLDAELTPISNPGEVVVLPPGASLVQLANRFQKTIRINAAAWNKMDDANKVALLIHEAVFSLLRAGVEQTPSSYQAREITGMFFSGANHLPLGTYDYLSKQMSIPWQPLNLSEIRHPVYWQVEGTVGLQDKVVFSSEIDIRESKQTFAGLKKFVENVCNRALATGSEVLSSTVEHRPLRPSLFQYMASRNPLVMQSSVTIDEIDPLPKNYFISVGGKFDCLTQFNPSLDQAQLELW